MQHPAIAYIGKDKGADFDALVPKVDGEDVIRSALTNVAAVDHGFFAEMKELGCGPDDGSGADEVMNQIVMGMVLDVGVTDARDEIIVWSNLYH